MKYRLRYWWHVARRWAGIITHPWDPWRRYACSIEEYIAMLECDPKMRAALARARMEIRTRVDLLIALRKGRTTE